MSLKFEMRFVTVIIIAATIPEYSSMNKKKSITVRNVLADPYDTFWPELGAEDEEILNDHMKRFLPLAKRPKVIISQKNLRAIRREKSKEKRKELWKIMKTPSDIPNEELEQIEKNKRSIVLGVNSVARGIAHSKVACCIVGGDASSRLLVQHVVASAVRRQIPVIVLNTLRPVTSNYLGIPCMVFGLKREVSKNEEHPFHPLYEAIKSIAEKFLVPEELITFSNDDDSNIIIEDQVLKSDQVEKSQSKREFVYLSRKPGSKDRVFVPNSSLGNRTNTGLGEFVPLSLEGCGSQDLKNGRMELSDDSNEDVDDDDDEDDDLPLKKNELFFVDKISRPVVDSDSGKLKRKSSHKLKPLTVKKIKGNPKRVKKQKKKL